MAELKASVAEERKRTADTEQQRQLQQERGDDFSWKLQKTEELCAAPKPSKQTQVNSSADDAMSLTLHTSVRTGSLNARNTRQSESALKNSSFGANPSSKPRTATS